MGTFLGVEKNCQPLLFFIDKLPLIAGEYRKTSLRKKREA
jgi:hypothetical protein